MKFDAKKNIERLKKWDAFTILKLGIVAIACILVYKGFKFFSNGGTFDKLKDKFFGTDLNKDEKAPTPEGIKPTITDISAKNYAAQIKTACDDIWGTDYKTILEIFKKLNPADLVKVYNTFGVQKYFISGSALLFGVNSNLVEWMQFELKPSQYSEIEPYLKTAGLI